jgi:hypothetical protein
VTLNAVLLGSLVRARGSSVKASSWFADVFVQQALPGPCVKRLPLLENTCYGEL